MTDRGQSLRAALAAEAECWADARPRSAWRRVLLLVVLMSLPLIPTSAEGCTCGRAITKEDSTTQEDYYADRFLKEERQSAVHVFSGTVLSVAPASGWMRARKGDTHVATFAVSRVWQGPVANRLQVQWSSRRCEFVFEKGKDYIVFAGGDPPTSSSCGFTMPIGKAEAQRTVVRLGEAQVPR
jgi:hypothetical protein